MKHGLAKSLRRNATEAERKLWARLRLKQMHGLRFRRQQPIGPYIADFFCAPGKLIVELDGSQHGDEQHRVHDAARARWLEGKGYVVLRFSNEDFLKEPDRVLEVIAHVVLSRTPPRTA